MCAQLLAVYPDACLVQGRDGFLPLHCLTSNGLHTSSSVALCEYLLRGAGKAAASERTSDGLFPLHLLCLSKTLDDHSLQICELLLHEYVDAVWQSCGGTDKDLALHKLCLTTPHTMQSIKLCRLLVHKYVEAICICGNHHDPAKLKDFEVKGIDPDKEPGDEPLIILCQVEIMTPYTAELCMMVSGNGNLNIHPALSILNQKVYRPRGDEVQQKLALRALISLAFVAIEDATSYISIDADATSGPRDVQFLKAVEREMGMESENPLLHVLRMAKLYKMESELTGSGQLVIRLSNLSKLCLEWSIKMVEVLPAKIAKKAIWAPEKYSEQFMRGSSPIGLALELGDLKIAASPAVFDVVRRAWPGKYKYDFMPFSGTVYSNLFLEFDIVGQGASDTRELVWTWPHRVGELLKPSILISSPMNMYFLGIMMQVALLVVFQIVLDLSHYERPYQYSMGPPEVYMLIHIVGGLAFEAGEILEHGLGYFRDPWNFVDMGMYGMLAVWAYGRSEAWTQFQAKGAQFIPDGEVSSTYMGLAGICIWLRMLNVFGLDPYFGPLVRIMQGMTTGVITFLILLAIFVMGFSTALRTIFRALDRDDPEIVRLGFDKLIEEYDDPVFSMISLLNMALGQFDLILIYQVSPTGLLVIFAFLTCTFVMLFNLLIALMTDTYSEIRLESEQLWKKDRALLMATYTTTDAMLEGFSMSTLMTALPQPLNLVVLVIVIITLPCYLLIEMKDKARTWERKANDLRLIVTKSLLFLIVSLPAAIIFMVICLPANWIFVTSAGTLDYLKISFLNRQPYHRAIVSRIVGLFATPFFLMYYLFYVGPMIVYGLASGRNGAQNGHVSAHGPENGEENVGNRVNVAGEGFGVGSNANEHDVTPHTHESEGTFNPDEYGGDDDMFEQADPIGHRLEIWEEQLDEGRVHRVAFLHVNLN